MPAEALIRAAHEELRTLAYLARSRNPKVTLGLYAGLADDSRERAAVKLTEGGFGN